MPLHAWRWLAWCCPPSVWWSRRRPPAVGVESYRAIDGDTVWMIATETGFGIAWQVRLSAARAGVACSPRWPRATGGGRTALLVLAAAVALSTLAWGGHGAMNEGVQRAVHLTTGYRASAGGGCVGGRAGRLHADGRSGAPYRDGRQRRGAESRAASGFAHVGTGIVVALAITGIVNYIMIAGLTVSALADHALRRVAAGQAGGCSGAMLGLAAVNRYRLSPTTRASGAHAR
ncbi:hypothetical protein ACTMU2_41525 [Cupriavidus basilensis]